METWQAPLLDSSIRMPPGSGTALPWRLKRVKPMNGLPAPGALPSIHGPWGRHRGSTFNSQSKVINRANNSYHCIPQKDRSKHYSFSVEGEEIGLRSLGELVTAEPRAWTLVLDLKACFSPSCLSGCFYPNQSSQTDLKPQCKIQDCEIGNKIHLFKSHLFLITIEVRLCLKGEMLV